ncbi:DUF5518 domain-containing protein [Halovivax cerinus]|uniref:DUF5518 domain-containing protein n=1 Tax=Halovivax cerinus TaxID=1487865 RepID=A0ABD5NKB6_9EURY
MGGLLAGYLAQRNARKPASAGIGAGILGGVPAYVWLSSQLIRTATAWPSPFGVVAIFLISIPVLLVVAALPGWIGGIVGGWATTTFGSPRAAASRRYSSEVRAQPHYGSLDRSSGDERRTEMPDGCRRCTEGR